jgi:hypothetical protein
LRALVEGLLATALLGVALRAGAALEATVRAVTVTAGAGAAAGAGALAGLAAAAGMAVTGVTGLAALLLGWGLGVAMTGMGGARR